jgi:hypothetical protein
MKKLSGSIAFIQLIYLCNFILEFQSPTNRKLEYKNWNLKNKNNMRDMYMIVEFGTMKEEDVGINYSIYKFRYLMTKVSAVCPLY